MYVTPIFEQSWFSDPLYYRSCHRCAIEYTPGFMHSKTFVADDEVAVVGTINLDYRSLYLHFENGVWLYKTPSVMQIKGDFVETLKVCQEIDPETYNNLPMWRRLKWSVLRLLAPLL